MNYRHQFHAGNFADVMKHALLVRLLLALQRKPKPFLYLDTHAGRGRYDLERAATGQTLARQPEWPEGIGRLWSAGSEAPAELRPYLELVHECDRAAGNIEPAPRFYPGSPWLARQLARPDDRLALFEKHPADGDALAAEFAYSPRAAVQAADGYAALRALLPPLERRALILIDPPYEAQDEFAQVAGALRQGLQRFATGVFAIWYPITGRARVDEFFSAIRELAPPPALACELTLAGEGTTLKLRGCGLVVLNPPWQFESEARAVLTFLAQQLAQGPGGAAFVDWVVPETRG
jgi:23S rRNA (adenine2030-N6)-methyltransferase